MRERHLSTIATSEDIRRFRDAVAGVVATGSAEALPAPDPDWRDHWQALVDVGAAALATPEALGGVDLQPEVAAATAMELGAALHGAPYAGLLASTHALAVAAADDARSARALAAILDGTHLCAFGRLDGATGIARTVDGAPTADLLLLEDPTSGDLLLLDDPSEWTTSRLDRPFDVSRASADVSLGHGSGHHLAADPTARHLYHLLLAADALGGTERALARTVAHARGREAFGRPIGGFQAVQHRLADHAIRLRGMTLAVREAARSIAGDGADTDRRVAVAEASVSGGAGRILHDLVQLTGAIGFTWEYGLHAFGRRVHHDARLAANPRRARRALATLEGWTHGR